MTTVHLRSPEPLILSRPATGERFLLLPGRSAAVAGGAWIAWTTSGTRLGRALAIPSGDLEVTLRVNLADLTVTQTIHRVRELTEAQVRDLADPRHVPHSKRTTSYEI